MEEKDIKNIANKIANDIDLEKEYKEIEEELFFGENVPKLEDSEKDEIRTKVFDKLDKEKCGSKKNNGIFRLPIKYMRIASIALVVLGVVAIGAPIARAVINNIYNYNPNEGNIVESTGQVYVLEEPISKEVNGNVIKLESFVLDLGNKTIMTKVLGEGTCVNDKSTLKIDNQTIESNDYFRAGGGNTWMVGHSFSGEFKYENNKDIVYTLVFNNDKVDFDVKLNKAKSVSDYSSLGSTDTKNMVAITAVSNENNNILDVNFIAKTEDKDSRINSYGKSFYKDEYDTGVVLKDINGRVVKGKLINHGDRANNFQFDTTNLSKPYTIQIPSVNINMYGILEGEEIKLDLPRESTLDIDKEIILKGANKKIVSENNKVYIKSIEKTEDKQYKINFDFPQNDKSKFKIVDLDVDAMRGFFSIKEDFSGYSTDFNVDSEILEHIILEPDNKNKKSIKFKLYPYEYKVEGNWNIIIE